MALIFGHPVAAAFVVCGVAYTVAVVALGWPFGRKP